MAKFEVHEIENIERVGKVVLCHGVFDIIHAGHILHLEDAKARGDILVVSITADDHITRKRKPMFDADLRAHQLLALEVVDHVIIVREPTALSVIEALKPDLYIKGKEYEPLLKLPESSIQDELNSMRKHGGEVVFTDTEQFSTTKIAHITGLASHANEDEYTPGTFRDFSDLGFTISQVHEFLNRVKNFKVAVVGDTITDTWIGVDLSPSDSGLAGTEKWRTVQSGGASIIASHLSNFVNRVDLYTNTSRVRVGHNIVVYPSGDGICIKTRYVVQDQTVYRHKFMNVDELSDQQLEFLIRNYKNYDAVFIADFGHGLISLAKAQDMIPNNALPIALMVQTNSTNFGKNLITKYNPPFYLAANRGEVELAFKGSLGNGIDRLFQQDYNYVTCTDGQDGSHLYHPALASFSYHAVTPCHRLPAISRKIKDAVGCGDALFSLAGLALISQMKPEFAHFVGAVGAAAMSQKLGNASPVSVEEFNKIARIIL